MPAYKYEGYSREGKPIKGISESISKQALMSDLLSRGIFVSEIKENTKVKKNKGKKISEDYFFQLAMLLKSGIPLVESHKIILKSTKNSKEREVILDIITRVSEGIKFSEVLGQNSDFFDASYISLIRASEAVGRLSSVLMDIAEYEENRKKNADRLLTIVAYPLAILTLGTSIVILMLTYIVPKVQSIYETANKDIPGVTKFMLSISGLIRNYGIIILIMIAVLILFFRYLYKSKDKFRLIVDKKLFNIRLISNTYAMRFASVLSFQLKEGLPLSDALYYSSQSIDNNYFRKKIVEMRERVQEGVKFSSAVKDSGVFPDLFPAAVATGETSGNLPELLQRVSSFYSKSTQKFINIFLSVSEPIFIGVLGLIVAFIALAMMLPLFDINSIVGEF